MTVDWQRTTAQEKREIVRGLIERQGMSYGQAAQYLGITRNQVAGTVNGANRFSTPIKGPGSGNAGRPPRPRPARPRPPAKDKLLSAREKARKARQESLKTGQPMPAWEDDGRPLRSEVWKALPGSSPVSIEKHDHGCRWPIGDDRPYAYCNNPVADEEGVYCPAHAAGAYRPSKADLKVGLKVIGLSR